MNKKLWIYVTIALGLIVIGYFVIVVTTSEPIKETTTSPPPPVSSPPTVSPPALPIQETSEVNISNWKTYRNEKYGFEVKIPPIWHTTSTLYQFYTSPFTSDELPGETYIGIVISVFDQYKGKTLGEVFNGQNEMRINLSTECRNVNFAGADAYDCSPIMSEVAVRSVIFKKNDLIFDIDDFVLSATSSQILSTFKFTK